MQLLRHLPTEVQWTLAGVLGLLLIASGLVAALRRLRPRQDFGELAARMRTWWILFVLFGVALLGNRYVVVPFFAFASFLAFKEYLSLIPTRRADRRVLFWAYLAIPLQYYWVYMEWYGMFIIFIPVYMFLSLPTRAVMIGETQGFIRALGTLHCGLMATVFSISHAAYLLVLSAGTESRIAPEWPSAEAAEIPGPGLLVLLILLTELNDVAQFVWGKTLGRIRVSPKVSPGKTLGGLLGGAATTMALAAVLGPRLTPMNLAWSTLAGLLIALGGFAGDLSISALKRDLGVKDSGCMLPGHGGILDRIDSLTYTAPLFFHFVYYLYF